MCTIDVAIVCWYDGKIHSEDRKTCTSKQKLKYKIKELFSVVETVIDKRLMLVMRFCHTVSSLRVSEGLVTLKNGSCFFVVEILHFYLEFGTQLNLQFE